MSTALYFVYNFLVNNFYFTDHRTKKSLIICDSIPKYISGIHNNKVSAYPGASIQKITGVLEGNVTYFSTFEIFIIHVGTNNINSHSVQQIKSLYCNLMSVIKRLYLSVHVVFSSVLPRPIDYLQTKKVYRSIVI